MKLTLDFSALEQLVEKMGAPMVEWRSDVALPKIEEPPKIRKLIKLEDISKLPTNKDGNFAGWIVYIENVGAGWFRGNITIEDFRNGNKGPRYHIRPCRTLRKKEKEKEYNDRYVQTKDDSGLFQLRIMDPSENLIIMNDANLQPCLNCTREAGIDEKEFSLKEHLRSGSQTLPRRTIHTPESMPFPDYTEDWEIISFQYRESVGWKCEQCHIDCSMDHHLLDTHHINRIKGDNRWDNLRALCKVCHQRQPHHQNMWVSPGQRADIELLREMR